MVIGALRYALGLLSVSLCHMILVRARALTEASRTLEIEILYTRHVLNKIRTASASSSFFFLLPFSFFNPVLFHSLSLPSPVFHKPFDVTP